MKPTTLPTLFSRTSTGAVQMWKIEISGDSYWTTHGQVDGKQVTSKPTKALVKNVGRTSETTPGEQAVLEATAKWEKKKKTGYTTEINSIDTCISYVEPMLAKHLLDRLDKIDWKRGVLVQVKFNGHRATARLENGKVVIKTRKGEIYYSTRHINPDLDVFFKKYPTAVLDGEMFVDSLRARLNDLSSIIRKHKESDISPEDFAKSEKYVRYYVYDGFGFNDKTQPSSAYEVRKAFIDKELFAVTKYCVKVESRLVHSMQEVNDIFAEYLADGHEGVIVRIAGMPYEIGKRSANLLKYKPCFTSDAVILALHSGTGNWAETAKTATLQWKGKQFDATFLGSIAEGKDRLLHPEKWIGKLVEFKYNDVTGLQVPNFARIDPANCFKFD